MIEPRAPSTGPASTPDATPTESRLARPPGERGGDESVDDEGLTREFTAVRAPAELLAALGELGFDDPAIDRPAIPSIGAPVPRLPSLRPATQPSVITGHQHDGDSTTSERSPVSSAAGAPDDAAAPDGTDTQPAVTPPSADPEGGR